MKYNYLFGIILFFGCTLTNQQKGENGIKDYLNKKMNDPKSYELIEFGEIEDDYTILSKDKNFINYKIKYDTFNDGKQKFEEDIRFENINALEKAYIDMVSKAITDSINLYDSLINDLSNTFLPIAGYKIKHIYRGKNIYGGLIIHKQMFYLDKNFNVTIVEDIKEN